MAAGLGFKTFTTGEVLTAADTNGYLMQGVLVFADATARDAAITSPQEGQFAYLKDTNVTTYYTGSAWANLDTTGMTNPMTTTGDTIYSSSGSTPARLGIGTAGQVLTVNSGATAPEWASPTSKVVQIVTASYATETTNATSTYADTGLTATITPTSASNKVLVFVSQNGVSKTSSNSGSGVQIKLRRASTDILTIANQAAYTGAAVANNVGAVSCEYLDSPATTSATTYKTQFANRVNVSAVVTQEYNISSTIVLMEVTP